MRLIRREDASSLVLQMLIWGVLTVLTTRLFLNIFNSPQVAFGSWHIAHMLWGGLLMLICQLLLLVYYNQKIREIAAVFGGIGWGLFIDEVGKFLTKDNNYLFRPAIIFIYISFVVLFIVFKRLDANKAEDEEAKIYSALSGLGQAIENDLEESEKKIILKKLPKKSNRTNMNIIVSGIRELIGKLEPKADNKRFNWMEKWRLIQSFGYSRFYRRKMILIALVIYSGYYAAERLVTGIRIITSQNRIERLLSYYADYDLFSRSEVIMLGLNVLAELIVAGFFVNGIYNLIRKRWLKGLRNYRYGLTVSILLVSIFRFYFEQFSAVSGLFLDMIVFSWIGYHRNELLIKANK